MAQKNDFCPEMLSALQNANSILLCSHVSPDGDTIGSLLAMRLALRGMGKKVTAACGDPVPGQLMFLPGADAVCLPDALEGMAFDAALAVDVASPERMGDCLPAFLRAPVTMQIDHHGDNPGYAMHNEVDGNASAAGCVVYRCIRALGQPVTKEIASCLYCAVSTDTGNFLFQNTTSEAFSVMEGLMEAGLDLPGEARRLHLIREEPHVRLLGRAIQSLRFFGGGKCACMALAARDFISAGALQEHTTGIVNYALDMPGVEMAYLLTELDENRVKVSLRSLPPRDVSAIARSFGGGGHPFAAAFRGEGTMEAVSAALEEKMLAELEDKP